MSESCSSSPTLTSTSQVTIQTVTTTTTSSVSTLPPTTTVSTITLPCTTVALPSGTTTGPVSACTPVLSTTTITHPGEVTTIPVQVTLPIEITSTSITTLYGTSCTTIPNNNQPDKPTPNPSPTPTPETQPSPTPTPTPTPVVVTNESVSTASNGSVTTVTTVSTQAANTIAANDRSTSTSDVGPIVGGAVGGFFGLLAIVALVWFILKRRRRWDDIFDKEDDEIIATGARRAGRFSLDVDAEPKPYQYGLVGQGAAPSAISPPNSPPVRPSVPVGAADILHARSSSLAPLNMPLTASAPLPSATTVSSRPSTAGSAQPLYPAPTAGILQQQQAQALQHQNYGRPSSTATHAHSHSSVSFTSPPVALAQWTGGAPGPGYNGGTAALMGLSMGAGAGAGASAAEDYFNRSGSPTSIQETRRLQVANARPLSPAESESFSLAEIPSSSSAAAAAAEPVVQRDGKGRIVSTGPVEPLVHLDGGRVEDLGPVASSSAVDTPPPSQAPPAYHE